MIFQKQLFRHNPEQGVYGDCARTVLACMLDLPPQAVPHFGELYWGNNSAWAKAEDEFLAEHGLGRVMTHFDCEVEGVLKTMGAQNPGYYYLLHGMSRNNTDHVVIAKDDKIAWDPAIDDSGIISRGSHGYVTVEFLVPLRFKQID